jgi:hypothetical protein
MDRLNQWLALVANLGVVVGIAFLAYEIQMNTESLDESRKLTRADMKRQMIQQYDEVSYQMFENKEIAAITMQGFQSLDSLEEADYGLFFSRFTARLDFFMAAFRLAQDGFLSEEYAENNDRNLRAFLEMPGPGRLWTEVSPLYPPSFREHVALLLRNNGENKQRNTRQEPGSG